MTNRLAQETSPYLIQHRDNPVDWYPWGPEALGRAREEDRPVLLSVGYSACHWCHVMERESFEDPETAAYMNEHFVSVKVDREERPDVDAIYMEAVQSITGHGGWPMTVFLDPDGVPFYGGTYFPPDTSRGMPSFRMVMEAVVHAWETQREEIREKAPLARARLSAIGEVEPRDLPGAADLEEAVQRLLALADRGHGGFGGAPKFPPASSLELLLARGETEHVERTLDAMLAGGIYDQLGGGFARYSVDAIWLVPHFEKMLYDNALLARVYLHGWQALGHERYRRVCEETLDWMLREMRGPEGGFYSALDADSEGEEGRFYVWTPDQFRAALTNDPNCINFSIQQIEKLMQFWGVTEEGNFEGVNVLHLAGGAGAPEPEGLAEARRALFEARAQRVRPGLDDKRLASWNALAIAALADAGAVLGREDYLDAARSCAEFVLTELRDDDGNLLRTYKDGRAHLNAYLEDHAFLLEALQALYEASFEARWFEEARTLAETTIARFSDPERGG
ncbi:MAG TPA: thioredoxin domain-containing protein, partial [Solirubrobacterales bacterium]|nr:thioredoxin domain-containing protein [Solirubrobacterales bacterium]